VTDPEPPCARCGRVAVLWGRSPDGRICQACVAMRNHATCAHCGEHRCISGRDPAGLAWCQRCRNAHRRAHQDEERSQRIVDLVRSVDSNLDVSIIEDAFAAAVGSRRSLRILANHLDAHPEAFTTGPTSTLPVLDRFTTALAATGAQSIRTIHPVCARCGRRRRWHARRPDGSGECGTCWARTSRTPCAVCGCARRVDHRDDENKAVCARCTETQRRRHRLDELAAHITAVVTSADPAVGHDVVAEIVDGIEPTVPGRRYLADALRRGPALTETTRRTARVARLLDGLRAAGSTLPAARCEDCADPADPLVIYRDIVHCQRCAKRCPECGSQTKEPNKPRCRRCERQPRGTCGHCGRPDRPLDTAGRCRGCRERAERRCQSCNAQLPRTWITGRWLCQRCALGVDLDAHLGPVDRLPTALVAVRAAIAAADNPTQVRKWLRTTTGGAVLAQLATGELALDHEALDRHGDDRSVAHLRALLVAARALPAEDRSVDRFEAFTTALAATITDPQDAKVVRAWLRWQVLPRLRARREAGTSMAHSAHNARSALRRVVAFLEHLHERGRALRNCTQADLDGWFAGGNTSWNARPFLVWARRREHLPRTLTIPAVPPRSLRPMLDGEQRWAIARRLVVDDTIDVADRVAAALVVLYGQPLARVARLTTNDVHRGADRSVIVTLDGNPVPIHEPFGNLIARLPRRRSNGMSDQLDSPWLFPGRHAGRHIGPVVLGERLREHLGVEALHMRNAARAQLAAEIPPALLGEIIGVTANTATRWAALTSGNWTTYAGDVASGSRA